jgi:hypothetical protein
MDRRLIIGAVAAGQRHYFSGDNANCAKVGTIAVTIVAGPLNSIGANPKITCHVQHPWSCLMSAAESKPPMVQSARRITTEWLGARRPA